MNAKDRMHHFVLAHGIEQNHSASNMTVAQYAQDYSTNFALI